MDNKHEKPVFKNIEYVIVDGIKRVRNKKTGEIVKHSMYDANTKRYNRKARNSWRTY
mgnify:CR=1 FL=1